MTTHRIQKVHELFDEALRRPEGERTAFLDRACGDDAELRDEVEGFLKHDEQADQGFLRPPEPADAVRFTDAQLVRERAERLVGREVGGYCVERIIAVGGMGVVYEAVQKHPQRTVALKVLHRNVASHSALRRFQFESQVLGRLRHPNVAHIYKAGMYDDSDGLLGPAGGAVPYFAMELIAGARPITQYADDERLDVRQRLTLFAQVCDAVHSGHQKGVIHRDLKPANILIDSTGQPKVIDFGVARGTDSDLAITTQQTLVGQLVGTMQYMSPEQCDADPHDLDTRSDVYSLGVVLYELLTGELPYDASGSTIFKATQLIKQQTPPRPSTINRKLRGDVETIVLKALEKGREQRYQSAADLAADLRRHLSGEPLSAKPATVLDRAWRWIGRHPAASTAMTCLAIAAVVLAATIIAVNVRMYRPYEITLVRDGREARLLARNSEILHRWSTDAVGGIAFADLLDRPEPFGGGQLAVLAFNRAPDTPFPGALCAFDIARDYDDPIWIDRIEQRDLLPSIIARDRVGQSFDVSWAAIADVFPERPGPEILAVFSCVYSQRLIRVYDLSGAVLYQFWHDGSLAQYYWMSEARLLVFAGFNSEAYWEQRVQQPVRREYPIVVFAVRPTLGFIGDEYLPSTSGEGPSFPVWYKCVLPPPESGDLDGWELTPPVGADLGRSVYLSLTVSEALAARVGWNIDEFGNKVAGTRVRTDGYNRNQLLPDGDPKKLPDPRVFKLGPLPPIQETPKAPGEG